MIHRKFDNLKFTRTYIGGSKQRENQLFTEVQGTKEDNSEVDWLEYRRMFTEYSNDVLNIVLSWQHILNILTISFGVLCLVVSFLNPYAGLLIFLLSIASNLIYKYLNRKEQKMLSAHNFSFDIILSAIKQQTGFDLTKN